LAQTMRVGMMDVMGGSLKRITLYIT
jgi:hypothetical protein